MKASPKTGATGVRSGAAAKGTRTTVELSSQVAYMRANGALRVSALRQYNVTCGEPGCRYAPTAAHRLATPVASTHARSSGDAADNMARGGGERRAGGRGGAGGGAA